MDVQKKTKSGYIYQAAKPAEKQRDVVQYPIVTHYEVNINNIHVVLKNKTTRIKEDLTAVYYNYDLMYNFGNDVIKPLTMSTHFLDITNCPQQSKNLVNLSIDLNSATSNGLTFKSIIKDIDEVIKKFLVKRHPTLKSSDIYITDFDKSRSLTISLQSFNGNITCPVHIHRSKTRGGGIVTLKEKNITDLMRVMREELPMFRSGYNKIFEPHDEKYIEKIKKSGIDHLDIHYTGKFVLAFTVTVAEYQQKDEENRIRLVVGVVAKEVEIKYNKSYVKSVVDASTETLKLQVLAVSKIVI
jgi:hypothetical protein